jgi:hypothetical protein
MIALSVQQPWVQLILLGKKRFETRTWKTGYRGPLAIQASRTFPEASRQLCFREPFRSDLVQAGFRFSADLPRGAVLGVVDLLDCLPAPEVVAELGDGERAYGDFRPGRWAWRLANPRLLPSPVPARGKTGLFHVELEPTGQGPVPAGASGVPVPCQLVLFPDL